MQTMNGTKWSALAAVTMLVGSLVLGGCATTTAGPPPPPPRKIDPATDQMVISSGVDYLEMKEQASDLVQSMLLSGVLERYRPHPVRMAISDIENKTNLSNFPKEVVLTDIRERLLRSGKVVFTAAVGRDGRDDMALDIGELEADPRFDLESVPEQGRLQAPEVSLRTQILWATSTDGYARQNTYEIRMFLTDLTNGLVVWEATSRPIGKVTSRDDVGW